MEFETGGGKKETSVVLRSNTALQGKNFEMFHLKDAPVAMPTGKSVICNRKPFIWTPDERPFHVTDETKLKVYCPEVFAA